MRSLAINIFIRDKIGKEINYIPDLKEILANEAAKVFVSLYS